MQVPRGVIRRFSDFWQRIVAPLWRPSSGCGKGKPDVGKHIFEEMRVSAVFHDILYTNSIPLRLMQTLFPVFVGTG